MSIDFDKFVYWAEDRFGDVVVKGNEVKENSIFTDDFKHHLWCNPYGGKVNHDNGVFHCWKTNKSGSLVSLVMLVDSCDYEEAMETLGGVDTRLEELEKRIEEIFSEEKAPVEVAPGEVGLKLPPCTYDLEKLPATNYHRVQAEVYLFQRSLPISRLMVCVAGDYRNRIVIPYYDRNGKLIYYNCRFMGDDTKLRYLGPPKEVGIGKSDVLYVPEWPRNGSKLYLCEGELDSLSLYASLLPSGAFGGKELSEKHINYILDGNYHPVLCVDSDKYGRAALSKMAKALLEKGVPSIGYVRPPASHKDWNKMLQNVGPKVVAQYIRNREKNLDLTKSIILEVENL